MVATRNVVLLRDTDPLAVPVYRVPQLLPGDRVAGPALLDDVDTTIWVPPVAVAQIDQHRNTIVEMSR